MPLPEVQSEPLLGIDGPATNPGRGRGRQNVVMQRLETLQSFGRDMADRVGNYVRIRKDELRQRVRNAAIYGLVAGIGVIVTLSVTTFFAVPQVQVAVCGEKQQNIETIQHFSSQSHNLVAVNLGGWLCLEDWFHSGSVGRYVSTPDSLPRGQGACLPPLLTGPLEDPWPSEGVLVNRLHNSDASPEEIFTAFRESFVTEQDFKQIAKLGIKTIRIPFSWSMFADALAPLDAQVYGAHDPNWEPVVVPDPFHINDIRQVTIPRMWFKGMLEKAASHGLRVILDLHNMPAGSSDGTYSGVWPLEPGYWNKNSRIGNTSVAMTEVGVWITKALLRYVEIDLADLVNRGAIWGICFMNEPAHLAGIQGKWGRFADPQQVLEAVSGFADRFRKSPLPSKGVRLYIQLIETAWSNAEDFDTQVTQWYQDFFTAEERYGWAVIARHFYTAWGCNGMITQGSAYQCDEPVDKIRSVLNACITGFAKDFAMKFHGLRAVTEWSIGSHWDANLACSNSVVLRTIFEENVRAFALISPEIQIEPVFWSWKMPYGPKFQPGWSLKAFAGEDELSDSNGRCVVGTWAKEDPLTGIL